MSAFTQVSDVESSVFSNSSRSGASSIESMASTDLSTPFASAFSAFFFAPIVSRAF